MVFRFCLRAAQSPTYYNLCHFLQEQGWKSTRFNCLSDFNETHFQYNAVIAERLEFKHLLAELVAQYCPEVMPLTYRINDENWSLILSHIAEDHYQQQGAILDQIDSLAWILKPALLNNGQHIKIFQKLSQIEDHFLQSNRLGGEHVLQSYLMKPYLLKGPREGHKFSIRMFVVLTHVGDAYLYPQGYFNIGLQPYSHNEFSDMRPHLTNEHLHEDARNVVQIPTEQYDFFKAYYPQIKDHIARVMRGLKSFYSKEISLEKQPKLAIFGFDFMIDNAGSVWLLEANNAPCFPTSKDHPLQSSVYAPFWRAFIDKFVLPIATKQRPGTVQYLPFENLTSDTSPLIPQCPKHD